MVAKRVLVVEDDPGILRPLEVALTKAGYDVIAARDGKEAMRFWREQPADLVITDLQMPERNGIELLLELRAQSQATPVIAMTDGGRTKQMDLLGDAKLLGAVQTIAKPFRLADMLALVDQLTRSKEARDADMDPQ